MKFEASFQKIAPRLYEYRLAGDWVVLAGRSDTDNDTLSIKLAAPNDWWFHVRGVPGSHVVLRVTDNREPDRETLRRAAAKPGTVQIRKEIILKVRPALPKQS